MSLKVKGLEVSVENKKILKGVELEIQPGEVVALMGPNGSGKSSLASSLMGHPTYQIESGEVSLDGVSLLTKTPDERARLGLFLAFQYPVGIAGVTVREMLLAAMRARDEHLSALVLRKTIEEEASILNIDPALLKRDLNEGFSGGEKKKMEILQMRILKPKYTILDETDSGLDIDALKIVAEGAQSVAKEYGTGILVITHYQRILKYLQPDRVLVFNDGQVVATGGKEIVDTLEKEGYRNFISESTVA